MIPSLTDSSWPRTYAEALACQESLRSQVRLQPLPAPPRWIAGVDAAYSKTDRKIYGAAVVLSLPDLAGVGSLDPPLNMVQEGAEFEKGDLFTVVFQARQAASHFFLQVFAMAMEGGAAGAEFSAELVQGIIPGEDGQVDFMNELMVTDGAARFHGKLREKDGLR
jgi:hypothetical protein